MYSSGLTVVLHCLALLLLLVVTPLTPFAIDITALDKRIVLGDLACYECSEDFKKAGTINHESTCLTLVNLTGRICSPSDNYCSVERVSRHKQIDTFVRGCAQSCTSTCAYNGYGNTIENCISCCNSSFCNTDLGSPSERHPFPSLMLISTGVCLVLRMILAPFFSKYTLL